MTTITIPSRFNGPVDSGNGGYTCGVIAGVVGPGAEVTLRRPPPLDTPMGVAETDGVWSVRHGDLLVAEAEIVEWDLEVPAAPSLDEAAEAATRYVGFDRHEFPICFTCGIDRDDGLGIWPGRVAGSDLVASPWSAPEGVRMIDGALADEIVWAALDCPGAWVSARDVSLGPIVLGRMAALILAPLPGDAVFVSYAWARGDDGRKSYAGTAVADERGRVLAYARQTWIELRD
ncbi:MAG: hypothetical protein A2Z12_06840 [Actinobacteria bacterium RBG_16_68_21]|nr:MAG: hypothetical protein A2Z12_06840 [Actinobacteria bacterium RBG_16_68_21]